MLEFFLLIVANLVINISSTRWPVSGSATSDSKLLNLVLGTSIFLLILETGFENHQIINQLSKFTPYSAALLIQYGPMSKTEKERGGHKKYIIKKSLQNNFKPRL